MGIKVLSRFPGANVRVLDLRTRDGTPELLFSADPKGGGEALWFDFRLEETAPDGALPETMVLSLAFFDTLLGGSRPSVCRPVIREMGKPWNRLRPALETRLADGQVLLSWTIAYPRTPVEVAFCYPYDRDDLSALLKHCKGYWTEGSIGLTEQGRTLTRLDNSVRSEGSLQPKGLYVMARQHAGATPGSWVLDGLLSAFSRARPPMWAIWAVPFANLDGVVVGEHGGGADPFGDCRGGVKGPLRHEERVLQRDMFRWAAQCRAELVLTLRAPGACETGGIRGQVPADGDDAQWLHSCRAWANVLTQGLGSDYAASDSACTVVESEHWGMQPLSSFVRAHLGCAVVAIDVPFAFCGEQMMTPKQYREAGQRLARAVLNRR